VLIIPALYDVLRSVIIVGDMNISHKPADHCDPYEISMFDWLGSGRHVCLMCSGSATSRAVSFSTSSCFRSFIHQHIQTRVNRVIVSIRLVAHVFADVFYTCRARLAIMTWLALTFPTVK
jgi:hypothetical protein